MPETEAQTEAAPASPASARKRYRLLAKAFMDGAVREPGHEFTLEEGQLGPHRTVVHGADTVHMEADRDADREVPKARDEPLYEEIEEKPEEPIEERHRRELAEFDERCNAEYDSMLARHRKELEAAKEAAEAHAAEHPAPEPGEHDGDGEPGQDEPEKARSIADADWATRPEHGASAADADWPGAKPPALPGQGRASSGPPAMNKPFVQSGPGHDPNVPS